MLTPLAPASALAGPADPVQIGAPAGASVTVGQRTTVPVTITSDRVDTACLLLSSGGGFTINSVKQGGTTSAADTPSSTFSAPISLTLGTTNVDVSVRAPATAGSAVNALQASLLPSCDAAYPETYPSATPRTLDVRPVGVSLTPPASLTGGASGPLAITVTNTSATNWTDPVAIGVAGPAGSGVTAGGVTAGALAAGGSASLSSTISASSGTPAGTYALTPTAAVSSVPVAALLSAPASLLVSAPLTPTPSPTPTPAPATPTATPTPTPAPQADLNQTVELQLDLTRNPFDRPTFVPKFTGRITDAGTPLDAAWCKNLRATIGFARVIGSKRTSLGAPVPLKVRRAKGNCEIRYWQNNGSLPRSWRGRTYEFTIRIRAKKALA